MNIWIGVEQLFLETKSSLFSWNTTQIECSLKTEQTLSLDGCSSCTFIWTCKSSNWAVTIGNVKKVLSSAFGGKIFEVISMSLSVFIDIWLKELSSPLNKMSTCISRIVYWVWCCFKRCWIFYPCTCDLIILDLERWITNSHSTSLKRYFGITISRRQLEELVDQWIWFVEIWLHYCSMLIKKWNTKHETNSR